MRTGKQLFFLHYDFLKDRIYFSVRIKGAIWFKSKSDALAQIGKDKFLCVLEFEEVKKAIGGVLK